ncbi:hypothetical protein V8C35DRAFT_117064 [Trichoderma chlorosporum]
MRGMQVREKHVTILRRNRIRTRCAPSHNQRRKRKKIMLSFSYFIFLSKTLAVVFPSLFPKILGYSFRSFYYMLAVVCEKAACKQIALVWPNETRLAHPIIHAVPCFFSPCIHLAILSIFAHK